MIGKYGSAPIIVGYAVRNEPSWLVDQFRENLGWVDGFAEVDNRRQTGGWGHEGEMRAQVRRAVFKAAGRGPAWLLQLDPDERLQDDACVKVPAALNRATHDVGIGRDRIDTRRCVFRFPLREMWSPTTYRTDNGWAAKKPRARLFYLTREWPQSFVKKPIHCRVAPMETAGVVDLDVWLYHLKNIEPANRTERAAAYLAADPTFRYQRREGKSWDWIADETGLVEESIPAGREFTPAYSQRYEFRRPS